VPIRVRSSKEVRDICPAYRAEPPVPWRGQERPGCDQVPPLGYAFRTRALTSHSPGAQPFGPL
jgi:hypothetical protein